MFIKLTKLDNSPVWLNASFIVTVEPRKGGGSIVVPIGDGLDYDVRERCEDVLALLEGAPVPKVVPIPVSDCLTKTPTDVSPEPELKRDDVRVIPPVETSSQVVAPVEKSEEAEGEVKKTVKKARGKAKAVKEPKTATVKKARTSRTKKSAAEASAAEAPAAEKAGDDKPTFEKPKLDLSEEEVMRLQKMAPGSINKLKNTLFTQFHVEDPSRTMQALVANDVISIERDHVVWAAAVDKSANN